MKKLHDISDCLEDIRSAIDDIEDYLARFMGEKRDFYIYMQDKLLRSGVERQVAIIGEATSRILKVDPDYPIQSARKIVGARNRVVHAYDSLNDETIWAIVVNHLPRLREEVVQLLSGRATPL